MEPERPVHSPVEPVNGREPVRVPRSQVSVKTVLTVCTTVVGAAAVIFLLFHSVITLTLAVTALLLAVALNHGVEWLERWGVARPLAIVLVMGALLGALTGAVFIIVPPAVAQLRELVVNLPGYIQSIRGAPLFLWLDERVELGRRLEELGRADSQFFQDAVDPVLKLLGGVLAALGAFITIIFLAIFMLGYGGRLVRGLLAEALPAHRERYERVLGNVYRSVGGYLSGLAIIAVVNATFASIFLAILGVPYFLPLGILSGLGSLIPLVGASVAGTLLALVAFISGGLWMGVVVAAYAILYQQMENHLLAPVIYKRTVELNPLVTLLGIIFFAELAGVIGAFLAVPIVGTLQIVIRELLLLRRERLQLPLRGDVAEQLQRGRRRPPFWRRPRQA